MTDKVLDSAGMPPASSTKQSGYAGVMGYFSDTTPGLPVPSKDRTLNHWQDYVNLGLETGAVWETTQSRSTQGYAAGQADAKNAIAEAKADGWPGNAIYTTTDSSYAYVNVIDYYKGWSDYLRGHGYRSGAYGPRALVDRLVSEGVVDLGWAAWAWDKYHVTPTFAGLWQQATQVNVGGVTCDYNLVLKDDWGQYPFPANQPQPQPAPPEDDMSAEDVQAINEHTDAAKDAILTEILKANIQSTGSGVGSLDEHATNHGDLYNMLSVLLGVEKNSADALTALAAAVKDPVAVSADDLAAKLTVALPPAFIAALKAALA